MSEVNLSPLFTWRGAIAESELPSGTKLTAFALSLHMNERGGSCFPSHDTLAAETTLSVASIKRHLRRLHEEGWLDKRVGQGRGHTNTYFAKTPGQNGVTLTPFISQTGSVVNPLAEKGGHSRVEKGSLVTPEDVIRTSTTRGSGRNGVEPVETVSWDRAVALAKEHLPQLRENGVKIGKQVPD